MTDNNDVTKIKMFHEFLHDYMEDYEVRGDNGDYQPSKTEKFIAFDIIMGLIDTDEFKEYFIDKSEVDKNEQTLRDKIKNIFKWCDSKFKYIKKLEKRIHKQRLALRKNWEIVRMQQAYRKTPLKTMWFDKSIALSKDNHVLRDELKGVIKLSAEYSHKLLIEELKVRELEKTFKHFHVNNQQDDFCKECGLYLTDDIHIRAKIDKYIFSKFRSKE